MMSWRSIVDKIWVATHRRFLRDLDRTPAQFGDWADNEPNKTKNAFCLYLINRGEKLLYEVVMSYIAVDQEAHINAAADILLKANKILLLNGRKLRKSVFKSHLFTINCEIDMDVVGLLFKYRLPLGNDEAERIQLNYVRPFDFVEFYNNLKDEILSVIPYKKNMDYTIEQWRSMILRNLPSRPKASPPVTLVEEALAEDPKQQLFRAIRGAVDDAVDAHLPSEPQQSCKKDTIITTEE